MEARSRDAGFPHSRNPDAATPVRVVERRPVRRGEDEKRGFSSPWRAKCDNTWFSPERSYTAKENSRGKATRYVGIDFHHRWSVIGYGDTGTPGHRDEAAQRFRYASLRWATRSTKTKTLSLLTV